MADPLGGSYFVEAPTDATEVRIAEIMAPDAIVTASRYRLVGSPVRVTGCRPEYRPPPQLGQDDT